MRKEKSRLGVVVVAAVAGARMVLVQRRSASAPTALTLYGNVDIREVELGFRVPGG